MNIIYSQDFVKSARTLPKAVQKKFSDTVEILNVNPFSPLLHTKPLAGGLKGFYSFRITRDWRVIFCFREDSQQVIFLIDVAHRKDIYK